MPSDIIPARQPQYGNTAIQRLLPCDPHAEPMWALPRKELAQCADLEPGETAHGAALASYSWEWVRPRRVPPISGRLPQASSDVGVSGRWVSGVGIVRLRNFWRRLVEFGCIVLQGGIMRVGPRMGMLRRLLGRASMQSQQSTSPLDTGVKMPSYGSNWWKLPVIDAVRRMLVQIRMVDDGRGHAV